MLFNFVLFGTQLPRTSTCAVKAHWGLSVFAERYAERRLARGAGSASISNQGLVVRAYKRARSVCHDSDSKS